MTVLAFPVRPRASSSPSPAEPPPDLAARSLARQLGLQELAKDLPPRADLVLALLNLAAGRRDKALLPVLGLPMEVALVRRGASVLVSAYHTDASPEVVTLDRRVPLRALLDAAASALREEADTLPEEERAAAQRLVARASEASIVRVDDDGAGAVRAEGGQLTEPPAEVPLAFGFEIAVFPARTEQSDRVLHADVHAMLFGGRLWAWARGRRIPIMRGPALLAVQRMLVAAGAVIEAAEQGRPANVRLRTGSFVVGLRRDKAGMVALSCGSDEDGVVTVPALELEAACGPILRLASEMLRTTASIDRAQARNLRVRALRAEVRRLFRLLKSRERAASFVNVDPDRLRASSPPAAPSSAPRGPVARSAARWAPRWSVALDGLDAEQCLLAGPLLVVGGERGLSAVDRDDGRLVWRAETPTSLCVMAGANVLSLTTDAHVELREAASGEHIFRTHLASGRGAPPRALVAMGHSLVPTLVLSEGDTRLVALDLRTGEPRWRLSSRATRPRRLVRAGRALLSVSGDTSLVAIDLSSGDIAWRLVDDLRFTTAPVVVGDTVVALTGEPGRGARELIGVDLYEGRIRFRTTLEATATAAPIAAGDAVIVPVVGGRHGRLVALEARSGVTRWSVGDPGIGAGGGILSFDDTLVVNAPGRVCALDQESGETRWTHAPERTQGGDVPRRLSPLLRGGALIVPSSTVEVLRASDGARVGGALPVELVPDVLFGDERGWIYVGEESGHLSACAPVPRLSLVR